MSPYSKRYKGDQLLRRVLFFSSDDGKTSLLLVQEKEMLSEERYRFDDPESVVFYISPCCEGERRMSDRDSRQLDHKSTGSGFKRLTTFRFPAP